MARDDGERDPARGRLRVDHPRSEVARLTIDNPTKRNALDQPLLDALARAVPRLDARCVVLTGAGDAFSAGYDIGDLDDRSFAFEAERLVAHPFAAALDALDDYPYPTLGALNGHAIGGGLELALACDLRVAAGGIRVGMPPAKLGLVYSHTGIERFLDAIGAARTRELFLVGRNIDADTALGWGLVNGVAPADEFEERALDLAEQIAANAPLASAGNKRVIRALLAADRPLGPDVEHELVELRRACFASEDFREGVRAFAEKRPARWRGR